MFSFEAITKRYPTFTNIQSNKFRDGLNSDGSFNIVNLRKILENDNLEMRDCLRTFLQKDDFIQSLATITDKLLLFFMMEGMLTINH